MRKLRLILVGGARPNFMKLAPLIRSLERNKNYFSYKLVHTGQHYDYAMSKIFFRDLGLPRPDYFLGAKSDSQAAQFAEIMSGFEKVMAKGEQDIVVVVGDVNSTLACAIISVKKDIPVAHIEAGLRSFD
ncbi:MAG: UDP-N-acetylglucosamine 2-epimerase, partial [Candidatus Omnitrophica bacterium]|nr:UDP-N-acetylglucosamine 2-epimerase [Candidatus Omnitrophota bacterium]